MNGKRVAMNGWGWDYYEDPTVAVALGRSHIQWTAMAKEGMAISHCQTTLKWRLILRETREKDATSLPPERCSAFNLNQFYWEEEIPAPTG